MRMPERVLPKPNDPWPDARRSALKNLLQICKVHAHEVSYRDTGDEICLHRFYNTPPEDIEERLIKLRNAALQAIPGSTLIREACRNNEDGRTENAVYLLLNGVDLEQLFEIARGNLGTPKKKRGQA